MTRSMPSEQWPRIAVVTPNLNGGAHLEETILSIVHQNYPNLEYIIVDGGSTDDSLDIIQRHIQRVDLLLQGRDRNIYDALAKGFEAASGEILAWLNSDDLYEPGALFRAAAAFRHHPKRDVVYFEGTILKEGWRLQNRPQRQIGYHDLLRGHILYQECVFFTRHAYHSVDGLDRANFRLAGDYDLWLRLAARYPFHFIPESAGCFRIRPGQLSGDTREYRREMEVARLLAIRRDQHSRIPPAPSSKRSAPPDHLVYPLRDEHLAWPLLTSPRPAGEGRCPLCGTPPARLLFTTACGPETRSARTWYHCAACDLAFVDPPPGEPAGPPRPAPHRPFATCGLLSGRPLYSALGSLARPSGIRVPTDALNPAPTTLDEFLHAARDCPHPGIATPNLHSVWAARYGPAWSQWHSPELHAIYSPRALRILAGKIGLRLRNLRTVTPVESLIHSELQAPHGACPGVTPADIARARHLLTPARGAALLWDRLGRGDFLIASLTR